MTTFYFIFSKCCANNRESLTCFLTAVSHQRVVEMLSSIVYISNKRKPQNASLMSPTTHCFVVYLEFIWAVFVSSKGSFHTNTQPLAVCPVCWNGDIYWDSAGLADSCGGAENKPGLLHNRWDWLTGICANAIAAELLRLNEDMDRCHPVRAHRHDRTGNSTCVRDCAVWRLPRTIGDRGWQLRAEAGECKTGTRSTTQSPLWDIFLLCDIFHLQWTSGSAGCRSECRLQSAFGSEVDQCAFQ